MIIYRFSKDFNHCFTDNFEEKYNFTNFNSVLIYDLMQKQNVYIKQKHGMQKYKEDFDI